ncbi:predicted protein [Sclerotinia sclerotiorum 1980 UF-70]|uniref:Uncharacterized protein n=1 Tax=Sclerotinia sclerotiorum (strain ATCC 18683 / 1980 / Ss-1) TaxID=665079 RepID=A7E4Y2_SCLS1|nr:predicted protein [Sclerotinia sclerotiorum 1980 UF-70]EDN90954.1 predicted protein [Sclerotinia sclerotiorum 1980 UF-70]
MASQTPPMMPVKLVIDPEGALNAARGSLHSKLLKGLFDPIDWFLSQQCQCMADSLFAYSSGLRKIGIWPIESCSKKSVQEILNNFDKFVCEVPKKCLLKMQVASKLLVLVEYGEEGDHAGTSGEEKVCDVPKKFIDLTTSEHHV